METLANRLVRFFQYYHEETGEPLLLMGRQVHIEIMHDISMKNVVLLIGEKHYERGCYTPEDAISTPFATAFQKLLGKLDEWNIRPEISLELPEKRYDVALDVLYGIVDVPCTAITDTYSSSSGAKRGEEEFIRHNDAIYGSMKAVWNAVLEFDDNRCPDGNVQCRIPMHTDDTRDDVLGFVRILTNVLLRYKRAEHEEADARICLFLNITELLRMLVSAYPMNSIPPSEVEHWRPILSRWESEAASNFQESNFLTLANHIIEWGATIPTKTSASIVTPSENSANEEQRIRLLTYIFQALFVHPLPDVGSLSEQEADDLLYTYHIEKLDRRSVNRILREANRANKTESLVIVYAGADHTLNIADILHHERYIGALLGVRIADDQLDKLNGIVAQRYPHNYSERVTAVDREQCLNVATGEQSLP